MARHKNVNWNLSEGPHTWEEAGVAVLMDIRDELQTLNRLLGCNNFLRIPGVLDQIVKNTKRARRRRKKATTA